MKDFTEYSKKKPIRKSLRVNKTLHARGDNLNRSVAYHAINFHKKTRDIIPIGRAQKIIRTMFRHYFRSFEIRAKVCKAAFARTVHTKKKNNYFPFFPNSLRDFSRFAQMVRWMRENSAYFFPANKTKIFFSCRAAGQRKGVGGSEKIFFGYYNNVTGAFFLKLECTSGGKEWPHT